MFFLKGLGLSLALSGVLLSASPPPIVANQANNWSVSIEGSSWTADTQTRTISIPLAVEGDTKITLDISQADLAQWVKDGIESVKFIVNDSYIINFDSNVMATLLEEFKARSESIQLKFNTFEMASSDTKSFGFKCLEGPAMYLELSRVSNGEVQGGIFTPVQMSIKSELLTGGDVSKLLSAVGFSPIGSYMIDKVEASNADGWYTYSGQSCSYYVLANW